MISVFLTVLVILIFYYIGKIKRRRDIGNQIPGPKGVPFLGYTKLFQLSSEDLFSHLIELQNSYKCYYKIWVGPSDFWCVIYEPKIVEQILKNQNLIKANDYKYLKPWLGNGLLTNEGKSWFNRRKAITPAFHFSILENFIDVFVRQSDILIQKIKTMNIDGDIMPHLTLCGFDIICETAMGVCMCAQTNMNSSYIQAVKRICHVSHIRMFNVFLESDFVFKLSKYYKPYMKDLKIVHDITQKIIEERRKKISQNSEECLEEEKDEFGRKKKMALLDVLLKTTIAGKLLADDEIQDEVNTFMFAGHDTTVTTIGFLLFNIAKYPEVQTKILQEIRNVFGDASNGIEITIKQLNELKYMDLVMKESMRIHTTVPLIGRQSFDEWELDDIKFPQNTNLTLWVYGLCHREDLFPEPEQFIPERFDTKSDASDKANLSNHFTYIPFSAGHRNCIGQKFAIYEMKVIITRILQNFEIELAKPNEELVLYSEIVLKSKNGIHLKFKSRKNN